MKKISFFLAILLLLCLALPACSLGGTAEDVSAAYAAAISALDFEKAHGCLWSKGDSEVSQEDFVRNYEYVVSTLGVKSIEVSDRQLQIEGDAIYLTFRISYLADAFTIEHEVRTRIIKDEGTYHIQYSPELILPGYALDNKLSILKTKGKRGEIFTADNACIAQNSYSDTVIIAVQEGQDINSIISSLGTLVDMDDDAKSQLRQRYNSAVDNHYGTVVAYTAP